MISPSDNSKEVHQDIVTMQLPIKQMSSSTRNVSRLEFHALEQAESATELEIGNKSTESNISSKTELTVLEEPTQAQAEQLAALVVTARNEAVSEARIEWELDLTKKLIEERSQVAKIANEFQFERTRYFAGVEAEVVKLAMAIAARVLHREAKLDPLLLTGVVRVALEKVAEDSTVILRVPKGDLAMWQGVFVGNENSSLKLIGDVQMKDDECVLETNVGRVELGVSAQLEEIERGFFDLMQRRPA